MGDVVEMTSELGFKYSILASGSTGNSFYLETPEKKILVDAGLSGKKITSLLAEIDRDPSDPEAKILYLNPKSEVISTTSPIHQPSWHPCHMEAQL